MALHPKHPQTPDRLAGLALCAGVGGLELGLHIAEPGYVGVGYVERNAFAAAVLVARMADAVLGDAPVWDDLASFDGRPWRGKLDIVTAGYPCQPFSAAATDAEPTIRATYGHTSRASRARRPLNGCSAKTSPGTSIAASTRSPESYRAWVSASKQGCFRRLRSALRIGEPGSSYWPTATVANSGNWPDIGMDGSGVVIRTPTHLGGSQIGLRELAKSWTVMWLFLTALGMRPTAAPSYPYSRPLHMILRAGTRSLPGDLTFNPAFTDWLMGWPEGWTDPLRPVTAWSAWLRRMRGELSRLVSEAPTDIVVGLPRLDQEGS